MSTGPTHGKLDLLRKLKTALKTSRKSGIVFSPPPYAEGLSLFKISVK
jgi:hypothetical protein